MAEVYSGENVKNEFFIEFYLLYKQKKNIFQTISMLLFIYNIIICFKKTIFIFSYHLFQR